MSFLPHDKISIPLKNSIDNSATYKYVINLVNPDSKTYINQGTDFLTSQNQISDWIETAYATAVTTSHTDHIATRSCDILKICNKNSFKHCSRSSNN